MSHIVGRRWQVEEHASEEKGPAVANTARAKTAQPNTVWEPTSEGERLALADTIWTKTAQASTTWGLTPEGEGRAY